MTVELREGREFHEESLMWNVRRDWDNPVESFTTEQMLQNPELLVEVVKYLASEILRIQKWRNS
jgi:hypothetical protein